MKPFGVQHVSNKRLQTAVDNSRSTSGALTQQRHALDKSSENKEQRYDTPPEVRVFSSCRICGPIGLLVKNLVGKFPETMERGGVGSSQKAPQKLAAWVQGTRCHDLPERSSNNVALASSCFR